MASTAKLRDLRSVSQLPLREAALDPRSAGPVEPRAALPPPRAPLRWLWLLDSLPMRAGRRYVARTVGRSLTFLAYLTVAVFFGLGSAYYMVGPGTRLTVETVGPWQRWKAAGAADADPYTRAHFARAGWLPMSSTAALYFSATRDSTGEALYADCDYALSGPVPVARRWTLTVFDMNGGLLEPTVGPTSVGSDTALPSVNSTIVVTLSQATSPGNWLSASGSNRIQLLLTLYGVQQNTVTSAQSPAGRLFKIDRTGCR